MLRERFSELPILNLEFHILTTWLNLFLIVGVEVPTKQDATPARPIMTPPNSAQSSPELGLAQAKTTQRTGTQTSHSVIGVNNKSPAGASGVTSRHVNNVKMSHVINEDELSDFYWSRPPTLNKGNFRPFMLPYDKLHTLPICNWYHHTVND